MATGRVPTQATATATAAEWAAGGPGAWALSWNEGARVLGYQRDCRLCSAVPSPRSAAPIHAYTVSLETSTPPAAASGGALSLASCLRANGRLDASARTARSFRLLSTCRISCRSPRCGRLPCANTSRTSRSFRPGSRAAALTGRPSSCVSHGDRGPAKDERATGPCIVAPLPSELAQRRDIGRGQVDVVVRGELRLELRLLAGLRQHGLPGAGCVIDLLDPMLQLRVLRPQDRERVHLRWDGCNHGCYCCCRTTCAKPRGRSAFDAVGFVVASRAGDIAPRIGRLSTARTAWLVKGE